MRILLSNGHPHLPQMTGGAQWSMHELALGLQKRGCEVAVLSGMDGQGWFGLRSRIRLKAGSRNLVCDRSLGYPVYRSWFPWEHAEEAVERFAPDVVCPQSRLPVLLAQAFRRLRVPVVLYSRNAEEQDLGGDPVGAADAYLANSEFVSRWMREKFGIEASVVPPLFDAAKYRVQPVADRRAVTFINPHPKKGRDIASALVRRCPDIPFLFVRAWPLSEEDEDRLQALARTCPNLSLMARTKDMRLVYAQTRIILAPSQWEEAWGRIATEAHFSGIPVLASDIGGLPEAVGPGGMLVRPDAPIEEWERALRGLLNPKRYAETSAAALRFSEREDIDPDHQLERFLKVAENAIDAARGAGAVSAEHHSNAARHSAATAQSRPRIGA